MTNLDHIIFGQRFLTSDPCADFDQEGLVDLEDFVTFASHFLHECSTAGPTPGRAGPTLSSPVLQDEVSWGRLKADYR